MRRRDLLGGAAAAATLAQGRFARAETYPTRPVRVLIGYGPGGLGDVTTRLVARR